MTHAPHFPAGMMHVQLSAAVLDDGRFVASASSAHSRIAAIVAGSSIATTVSLSPDTPCCSSAPSDALVDTPFRIPLTDTLGFAAAALAASCLACYPVVDSLDELLDLDRGSWEGSLPDSSSLGEDGTPLRGAFIIDSASLTGFQELTAGKTLSILREWRILIAIDLRQPGPLWSAKLAQSYAAADSPAGRIVIGLVAGMAVVLWSEHVRRSGYAIFSYSLKAIGIGVLYLSLWASSQLYNLIPNALAFFAMAAVTASTVGLALWQDAEIIAAFAALGAFITPVALSTGVNNAAGLFSYL